MVLFLRPVREVPGANQAAPPLVISTSEAAGGIGASGSASQRSTCVWNGFQSVSKRWDATAQTWMTLGPLSGTADPADIVVTLEQVDFCGPTIRLNWSLRNNSADTVAVPISAANIGLLDSLHNSYSIAEDQSSPSELRAAPGRQTRATVVVARPVSKSAITLKVTLRSAAIGDTSWLVCLDGCQ
jgi:hypothetical protein